MLEAEPRVRIDYLELADPLTLEPLEQIVEEAVLLVAASLGDVRLIDNALLRT